jgi:hypothetical protein
LQVEALEDRCLLSFSPAVNYPVGLNPYAVATGDFNGDSRLDLAVANQSSNTVSILLGKGDGTFQPAQNFATGIGPKSLAVGDFNHDGKLDIVTANANDMSVLLGNGNGTFQPARNFGIGSNPQSVAVGDFNGDGKLDLAVASIDWPASYFSGSISDNVLLGNGDGSFGAPIGITPSSYPVSAAVAVADFNGDGKLDFATAEATWFQSDVAVALGTGTGTLGLPSYFNVGTVGYGPNSVAAGDVNGDGKVDLVTANASGTVSVLLGNGTGSFAAAQNYLAGSQPGSVALADFNSDGKLDIVVTNAGGVGVLLGTGTSSFSGPVNAAAGTSPAGLAVGDFNGDGRPDLAVANNGSNNISVLINDGTWPAPTPQINSLVVSGFPSSTTAGTAGSFTITAKYADGTTATNYTGTVHFTSSDGQAGLPANYTFTAADAGVHTFSAILKTAGTQSLTVTDVTNAGLGGSERGITVNPLAANKLDVVAVANGVSGLQTGDTIIAGSSFNVTVTALDPYNNIATSYTGTIHFTSTDRQASLEGDYTFTAADAGQQFFGASLKTAGTQSITATDTVTSSITGSTVPVTIIPAAAGTMTVAGFPSPTTAGVAGSFTVTLKDPYANIASDYRGTVHLTSSDGKASLPANYTFTAADAGVHTFSATLKTAGTQSLTATDTTTVSLTGTDGGITVKPGAASQFILNAPASVTAGVGFSLTFTVKDAYGNVVTGYTGTIHFTSTDTTATLPANYTFTAADKGLHTFTGLVLRKKGTQKITLTDTLNSSLTGSVIENVL